MTRYYKNQSKEELILHSSLESGVFLIDGMIDGILIDNDNKLFQDLLSEIS